MMPSAGQQPRHRQYSVRWQARLDAETQAKVQALAQALRRTQAAIVRCVMQWALARTPGWTVDRSIPASPHPVTLLVPPELLQQVRDAAAHGASLAAWVRQAMRHVTLQDFPASWLTDEPHRRSHESAYYQRKFGLRLDAGTSRKLEGLTEVLGRPAAEVIRQLIAQAVADDFPESWRRAEARRPPDQASPSSGRGGTGDQGLGFTTSTDHRPPPDTNRRPTSTARSRSRANRRRGV